MSFDKGFNFRGTSGYVTDGANETYVVADGYPTTRNSVTFGWTVAAFITQTDRSAANDRRLAGINYSNGGVGPLLFQVDLPSAGTYGIHLALGDQGGGGDASCNVVVKDSSTTLASVNFAGNVSNNFTDATGAVLNNTTWPAGEAGATLVFATSTLTLTFTSSGFWTVAHLFVTDAVGGGGRVTKNTRAFPLGMAIGMRRGEPGVYSAPMARHSSGLYVPERMAA